MTSTASAAGARALIKRCAAALDSAGHRSLAQRALQGVSEERSDDHVRVVVAGELRQGKSTLVNALLGHPGRSPLGTTSTTIDYRNGGEAAALVHTASARTPHRVGIGELAEWATVQGNPMNTKHVVEITVSLPVRVLEDLVIVDTPGIGGLSPTAGEFTLRQLDRADALVFVTDAHRSPTQSELEFLARAIARTAAIAIVLTKIDEAHDWRRVADETREKLEAHVPRLARAPMYPVSAQLALEAHSDPELGDEVRAADLQESGVERLSSFLTGTIRARRRQLLLANGLVAARTAAAEAAAIHRVRAGLPSATQRSAQSGTQELQAEAGRALQEFEQAIDSVRRTIDADAVGAFRQLTVDLETRITACAKSELDSVPDELARSVADTAGAIGRSADERVAELARQLSERVDASTGIAPDPIPIGLYAELADRPPPKLRKYDRDTTIQSFALGGIMVTPITTLGPLIGMVLLTPIGLAAGAMFGWALARDRNASRNRTQLLGWVRQELNTAQTAARMELGNRIQDARSTIARSARENVDMRLAECKSAAALGAEARAAAARQLAVLDQLVKELDAAARAVLAAVDGQAVT